MSAVRGRPILFVLVAGMALMALLSGCASQPRSSRLPRSPSSLAPILPADDARLEAAPPAARDALDSGLLWIVADAPETRVGQAPTPPTAPKGGAQ
jgi:hypothetical protein